MILRLIFAGVGTFLGKWGHFMRSKHEKHKNECAIDEKALGRENEPVPKEKDEGSRTGVVTTILEIVTDIASLIAD